MVAAGRAEYLAVPTDSGRFAPYTAEYVWAEPLLYVPDQAYRRLTGEEWNRDTARSYESYSNTGGWAQPPADEGAGRPGREHLGRRLKSTHHECHSRRQRSRRRSR